jgi:predicted nuclease with TOPRIM domain
MTRKTCSVNENVLPCLLQKKVALAQEQAEVENEIGAEQERIEGIDAEAKRLTDETNALKNK